MPPAAATELVVAEDVKVCWVPLVVDAWLKPSTSHKAGGPSVQNSVPPVRLPGPPHIPTTHFAVHVTS